MQKRDLSHIKFQDPSFREGYLNKVMNSVQEEKYRGPVPGEGMSYPIENWTEFIVVQKQKPIKLATYLYPSECQRRAVFVIFHGLNAHIGRSVHIASALSKRGIETVGFDFRGFGKSEGIRGLIESEVQHFEDCEKFIKIVLQKYPQEKIFIGGQSLGGQTAYKLSLTNYNRFSGVILYAPAIKDNKKYSPFVKRLGSSNKNPAVSEFFLKDPLSYSGKVIPGTVRTILNCSDRLETTFSQYKAPFLIFQAGIDKLVDPLIGFDLMKESPSTDKTHVFYENCWHNMWGEIEIEEAIKENIKWILDRC